MNYTLRHLTIIAVILLVAQVRAQESFSRTADPATLRAKLSFLAGIFTTETRVPARPSQAAGASGTGTLTIAWGLDSTVLLIDDVSNIFGNYKAHGILSVDAQTHEYILSMFSTFGDHPVYTGTFDGDTLVMKTTIPMPGRSFEQRLTWHHVDGKICLRVMNDFGRGSVTVLEQTGTPQDSK